MRTITTNIYEYKELSEQAKSAAIENFRYNDAIPTDHVYHEAHKTVKAFNDIFKTKEGNRSWLDFSTDHLPDEICNMKGLRLHKYIINNFWSELYLKKTYYKSGSLAYKERKSNIAYDNSCVISGWCYDDSILQPVYEFLEGYSKKVKQNDQMDFIDLMKDCFYCLKKDIDNEVEAMSADEYIIDHIEANEYEFTINGNRH